MGVATLANESLFALKRGITTNQPYLRTMPRSAGMPARRTGRGGQLD